MLLHRFWRILKVVRPRMYLGREMALARQINLIVMLSMIAELLIELILSFYITDFINLGTVRVALIAFIGFLNIYLIGKGHYAAVRISTIFVFPFLLFFVPLFIPRLYGEFAWYPYAAIACSLIPIFILEMPKNRTLLKISYLQFGFYVFFLDLLSKKLGNTELNFNSTEEIAVSKIAQAFIFIFISTAILYLKRQNRDHEEKLEKANNQIREKNSMLEQQAIELLGQNQTMKEQKEELQAINEELCQYQDELKHKNSQLQDTLNQLKQTQAHLIHSEKMASLGVLTASIAHEINNPLNYIGSGVDGLNAINEELEQEILKNCEDGTMAENLSILHNEAVKLSDNIKKGLRRASEIVGSLNRYARLENDQLEYCNVYEILESAITILSVQAKGRVAFHFEQASKLMFYCFPVSMGQIMMNIIGNAIDAIDDTGNIWISAEKSNSSVIISIKDDGKGMDEATKIRAFEPFFTTKGFGHGTGLGMAIVKELVDKHIGSIDVQSEPGKGTSFIINIPANLDNLLNNQI